MDSSSSKIPTSLAQAQQLPSPHTTTPHYHLPLEGLLVSRKKAVGAMFTRRLLETE